MLVADNKIRVQIEASGNRAVTSALDGVTGALRRLDGVANQVSRGLGGLFAPLLGAAAITVVVRGFKSIVDSMDEMNKAAQRVGLSTKEISALAYAADLSGASFAELETGLSQFSRRLQEVGEGTTKAGKLLRQFGVEAGDDTQAALAKIADGFARAEDGAGKTAAAMELFGRAGTSLIPLLNQGAAGIGALTDEAVRLGVAFDQETGKAAEDFNDNLTRLGAASRGLAVDLAGPVVRGLADVTNAIVIATQESSGLYGALRALNSELIQLGTSRQLARVAYDIGSVKESISDLESGGGLFGWVTTEAERGRVLEELRGQLRGLKEEQDDLIQQEVELRRARTEGAQAGAMVIEINGGIERSAGRAGRAASGQAAATDKATAAISRSVEALKRQRDQLVLGERGLLARDLSLSKLTAAEQAYALALYDEVQALEAAAEGAKATGREVDILATVTERAAEGMTDAMSDAFSNIFRDGVKSFSDFAARIKNLFYDLLGDLLAASLANPIRIALGVGGSMAAGGAQAGSLLGGLGNVVGGVGNFLSNPLGSIGSFLTGNSLGISAGNLLWSSGIGQMGGAATSAAINLAGAPNWALGGGGLLGGIAGNLLFGGQGYGGIGSGVGSSAGSLIAAGAGFGPVGMILGGLLGGLGGGFLGSLFADKTDPRAQWGASVTGQAGGHGWEDGVSARSAGLGISFGLGGASHGVKAEDYQPVFDLFAGLADSIAALVGPDVSAAITQRVGTARQGKATGLTSGYTWDPAQGLSAMFGPILDFAAETGDAVAILLRERVGEITGTLEEGAGQIAAAIAELGALPQVAAHFERLGINLGLTEEASGRAVLAMADLAGGMDALAQAEQFFFQNFYTQTEQLRLQFDDAAGIITAFNDAIGRSGDAAIDTRAELRAYVDGLDLTTEAGRAARVEALRLAPAILSLEGAMRGLSQIAEAAVAQIDAGLEAGLARLGDAASSRLAPLETAAADLRRALAGIDGAIVEAAERTQRTIETVRLRMLDEQGQYEYLRAQAEEIAASLAAIGDPAELEAAAARLDGLVNSALRTLTTEQLQAGMGEDIIRFLDETGGIVAERLGELRTERTEELASLEQHMAYISADFQQAADSMIAAAEIMRKAAAAMPAEVRVSVSQSNWIGESEVG